MARKKSLESIESEIKKTTEEMSKLQDRYDKLGENLRSLSRKEENMSPTRSWTGSKKAAKVWKNFTHF